MVDSFRSECGRPARDRRFGAPVWVPAFRSRRLRRRRSASRRATARPHRPQRLPLRRIPCAYTASVNPGVACPIRSATVRMLVPLATNRLAKPCRRSCSRTPSSPTAARAARNALPNASGSIGLPSPLSKTYSPADHAGPASIRRSRCSARTPRSAEAMLADSGTVRRERAVLGGSTTREPFTHCNVPSTRSVGRCASSISTAVHRSANTSPLRSPLPAASMSGTR